MRWSRPPSKCWVPGWRSTFPDVFWRPIRIVRPGQVSGWPRPPALVLISPSCRWRDRSASGPTASSRITVSWRWWLFKAGSFVPLSGVWSASWIPDREYKFYLIIRFRNQNKVVHLFVLIQQQGNLCLCHIGKGESSHGTWRKSTDQINIISSFRIWAMLSYFQSISILVNVFA